MHKISYFSGQPKPEDTQMDETTSDYDFTLHNAVIYILFLIGLLMTYFILFPISFQFLATYQVDEMITNTITLDSYISTFTILAFMMGIVFQLPVFAFILGKMGFIDAEVLKRYRAYAFIIIMIIAAIITPPDLFTLVMVTIPIYALYELSILVLKKWCLPIEKDTVLAPEEDSL